MLLAILRLVSKASDEVPSQPQPRLPSRTGVRRCRVSSTSRPPEKKGPPGGCVLAEEGEVQCGETLEDLLASGQPVWMRKERGHPRALRRRSSSSVFRVCEGEALVVQDPEQVSIGCSPKL